MNTPAPKDYVLIVSKKKDSYLIRVDEKGQFSTHEGNIAFTDIIGNEYGSLVRTHLGAPYYFFKPALTDFLRFIRRKTQVLYAKDIGYIILKLAIGSGARIIECGSGSGAAATAFAFALQPEGRLYSYDAREEFSRLARENVKRLGLEEVVEFKVKAEEDGFDETGVDAVFLDMKFPLQCLAHAAKALRNGGNLCVFVPTANQASETLRALEEMDFYDTEACELMLRHYKTVPDRFRPDDTMNAHTGYLIFSRKTVRPENE